MIQWTEPLILDRMRDWNARWGEAPCATDWSSRPGREAKRRREVDGPWPTSFPVLARFPNWQAALDAAGLEPRDTSWRGERGNCGNCGAYGRLTILSPDRCPACHEHRRLHGRERVPRAVQMARHAAHRQADIVARMRAWERRFGRPPTAEDWNPSTLRQRGKTEAEARWAQSPDIRVFAETVRKYFGSWNAGIAAAGFKPLPVGGKR